LVLAVLEFENARDIDRRVAQLAVAGHPVVTVAHGDAVVAGATGNPCLGVRVAVGPLLGDLVLNRDRPVAGDDRVVAAATVDVRVADTGLDLVGRAAAEHDRVLLEALRARSSPLPTVMLSSPAPPATHALAFGLP